MELVQVFSRFCTRPSPWCLGAAVFPRFSYINNLFRVLQTATLVSSGLTLYLKHLISLGGSSNPRKSRNPDSMLSAGYYSEYFLFSQFHIQICSYCSCWVLFCCQWGALSKPTVCNTSFELIQEPCLSETLVMTFHTPKASESVLV